MEITHQTEFSLRVILTYRGRCIRTEEGLRLGSFLIPWKYISASDHLSRTLIFEGIVLTSVENLEAVAYVNGNVVLSFPTDDTGPYENLAIPCSKIAEIQIEETETSTFKFNHGKKKLPRSA